MAVTRPAVSQHLRVLKEAGLVTAPRGYAASTGSTNAGSARSTRGSTSDGPRRSTQQGLPSSMISDRKTTSTRSVEGRRPCALAHVAPLEGSPHEVCPSWAFPP
ncbi:ArsR/SmtB family transcription factor [Methylobacterium oryzisoli]|uniref:ArsR/SmtB family transcription factor n=1 Tax=Methylobacterium oryzisoli TaxID=3385502 RepID=UPI0038914501